ALTVTQFLVVIPIIVVLSPLLVPAVQKVREAANRTSCKSNLHNVGLALLNFESTRGRFPPGTVTGPNPECGVPAGAVHSCWPFLLPYLEQQTLSSLYHWEVPYFHDLNQPAVTTPLKVLQCPSADPNRMVVGQEGFTGTKAGACADYAPVTDVASTLADRGWIDVAGDYRGVLAANAMTYMSQIRDGTSHTILIAEDAGRPTSWKAGRSVATGSSPGGPWASFINRISVQG